MPVSIKLSAVLNSIELTTASIERHHPLKGAPGADPIATLAYNVQLLQLCIRALATECKETTLIDLSASEARKMASFAPPPGPERGCPTPELRPKSREVGADDGLDTD